ncbi:MAG: class I SAM-dependent methyltransferase [Betaproteobacteria bacterium]|nr:class I SAM-dependent methyltransferase [Betaproteobacteria bacterium]
MVSPLPGDVRLKDDRPSSTALLIAASTVYLKRDPRIAPLIPDAMAAASEAFLARASRSIAACVKIVSRPGWRWLPQLAQRLAGPGLPLHFIVRKRFIEDSVHAALAAGTTQVMVLGAGFDTLTWRLHTAHPAVSFFEIDHPATQHIKRDALGSCDANLRFIPADLTQQTLQQVLARCAGFRRDLPTIFVIEGVLMYLNAAEVDALFAELPHSVRETVIFSVMETMPDGRTGFHDATFLSDRILRLWREPFRSSFARSAIEPFLARHGYALAVVADEAFLRARCLPEPLRHATAPARGEIVCVAHSVQASTP